MNGLRSALAAFLGWLSGFAQPFEPHDDEEQWWHSIR